MDRDYKLEAEDGVGGQIINQDPGRAKEPCLAHLLCYIFILLVLFTYEPAAVASLPRSDLTPAATYCA